MRFAMMQFGGSNCDRDTDHVLVDGCRADREGWVIPLPIAHAEGRYVAPGEVLARLNRQGGAAFRFCDELGNVAPERNPHGSDEGVKIFNSVIAYIEEYRRR